MIQWLIYSTPLSITEKRSLVLSMNITKNNFNFEYVIKHQETLRQLVYKLLQDSVCFEDDESFAIEELPKVNLPTQLGFNTTKIIVCSDDSGFGFFFIFCLQDEKTVAKIKEQMKLVIVLEKQEKSSVKKIMD